MAKQPTQEQLAALVSHAGDGPVVMVNVLRFEKGAGAGEYRKYADAVAPILRKIGAQPLYTGTFDSVVIGDIGETFDAIALVRYPSRKAFLEMATSAEYQAIHHHRDEGLESQWLLASTPTDGLG